MSFIKTNALLLLFALSCNNHQELSEVVITESNESLNQESAFDYRGAMRDFVIGLGTYAKSSNPDFKIIPQNGIELVTLNGEEDGRPSKEYLELIDGHGQEDLFYGYKRDNVKTAKSISERLVSYLQVSQQMGNTIFVIDYCSDADKIKDAKAKNENFDFVSFAAPERDLTVVPEILDTPNILKSKDIYDLKDASNFLFFLNYDEFNTKQSVIAAIAESDYDVGFMDMFFNDGTPYSSSMIEQLKTKSNGAKRLVISYMSIGEAEDYRFYWQSLWSEETPTWLDEENKNWPGNFKVKYWEKQWQNIIFGNNDSYLDRILATGFDGVYLDIIDAFYHFEEQ